MANMSYCRFENTLLALEDCYNSLDGVSLEAANLSETELKAAKELIRLCGKFNDEYFDEAED